MNYGRLSRLVVAEAEGELPSDGAHEHAPWRLAAPAKLNLWLTVVGQRADGFHELDSLLVLLELADEVSVGPVGLGDPGDASLRISGPAAGGVPGDRTNLAWRGWAAGLRGTGGLTGMADRSHPSALALEKRVPAAAGLGGGSSDAAAAWRLARWVTAQGDGPATTDELATLSAIGADVPFFAARVGAARVRGVGEQVEPADHVDQRAEHVVLVHPPFGLATGAVFAELRRGEWSGPMTRALDEPWRNDLERSARRLRPELDDLFRLVAGAGGEPHLTGSGPTVFALTDDPQRADGVTARLERAGVTTTRTRLRSEPASIER